MKYTVLLLRPDYQQDGHPSDWVFRAHVKAADPGGAEMKAINQLDRGKDGVTPAPRDEVSVLAIYEGHLRDHFCP